MRLLASADLHGFWDVYTWLVDVASAGKKRAMVIDLETMEHEVVEEAQVSDG